MSDLENAVKPILGPMVLGKPTTLTSSDQLLLSRWTLKTAIMFEFASDVSPRHFTQRDRYELYRHKAIPDFVTMWAGSYIGDSVGFSAHASDLLKNALGGPPVEVCGITLAVGYCALQVCSHRWAKQPPDTQDRSARIAFKPASDWNRASFQIWPWKHNQQWPPEEAFDDDGIRLFANRLFPSADS